MMPYIILISGYLKSGKDTVGKYLSDVHGYVRFAFADELKSEASALFHLDRASLDTQEGKDRVIVIGSKSKTVRSILIEHGRMRRRQNVDYWVEKVLEKMRGCNKVVITDWRFPNEYSVLREYAYIQTWRINRWIQPPILDETETSLDNFSFDVNISNNGSLNDLTEKIAKKVPLNFLLVDVDGILLRWANGFEKFVQGEKYTLSTEYPQDESMMGWICQSNGLGIPWPELEGLIGAFNNSKEFGDLKPYEDAQIALSKLKHTSSCNIVAISSCGISSTQRRKDNLKRYFTGLVDDVVCLPLGSSKLQTLRNYQPSIWIDDNIQNVIDGAKVGHDAILFERPWTKHVGQYPSLQRTASWDAITTKFDVRV